MNTERKLLFEKDFFAAGKGNPKSNEGFAVPIEADGKVSVIRIELLQLPGRNEGGEAAAEGGGRDPAEITRDCVCR